MASVQAMACSRGCGFETPAVLLDTYSAAQAFAAGTAMGKLLAKHKGLCGGSLVDKEGERRG
jgi:hypothetical protein